MPLARHDVMVLRLIGISTFLLTCLLRGMTFNDTKLYRDDIVSTHMPLARHDMGEVEK